MVNLCGSLATATAETSITVQNSEADGLPKIRSQVVFVGPETKNAESPFSLSKSSLAAANLLNQCLISLAVLLRTLNHSSTF